MLFAVLVSCAVLAAPWPGETAAQAVDLTSLVPGTAAGFGQQVSDLHWNPVTRTLWVSRAPGGVWALTQGPDGGFRVAASYPAINSDYEGITQADFNEPAVFMLDEFGGAIRKYSVDGAGTAVLLRTWSLAGVVPPLNGNAGPEGLTFVPDDSLRDAGFPTSAFDGGGLFLVAHQNGGQIYAVDLDPANGAGRTLIAALPTGRGESSGLAFDRSSGRLYVSHNTGTNFLEVDTLLKAANGGLLLNRRVEIDSPSTSNLEGFAVTPQYAEDGGAPGERWCFWADDDGNSVGRPGLMWFRQLPASLNIVEGNGQAAQEQTAVVVAPATVLRDAFGNGYVGQGVSYAATAGGGSVMGGAGLTSSVGQSAVGAWILGAPGPQSLTASATDFGLSVMFSAAATAAPVVVPDAGQPDAGIVTPPMPTGCGCNATASPLLGLLALMAARARRRR